jgi:hypothetical protein
MMAGSATGTIRMTVAGGDARGWLATSIEGAHWIKSSEAAWDLAGWETT